MGRRRRFVNKSHTVKLMDWIKHRYGEEYKNFISHQTANGEFSQLPMWSMYGDPESKAMEKEALIIGHRCETRRSIGLLRESEEALDLTLRNFSPFSFQSKTVRRAVLEVTDCLDHVPNVSLMPARGQGQEQRASQQWKGRRTAAVRRRPSATDPGIRDGPFPQARKATPAAHQGANLMEEAEPPKENVDPKRFSWLECEPLPLPQLREEEEPFRVEEMSSKRRSPMRVVGQRGK